MKKLRDMQPEVSPRCPLHGRRHLIPGHELALYACTCRNDQAEDAILAARRSR